MLAFLSTAAFMDVKEQTHNTIGFGDDDSARRRRAVSMSRFIISTGYLIFPFLHYREAVFLDLITYLLSSVCTHETIINNEP